MALHTSVARFVVDHDKVTEEGGRLRTFPRRRLDESEVDLHVLAHPDGAKGEELAAQALDAIGRLFLQDRLSLTGGLLRALKATHQTLLDWNRRSLPREQVSSGLTAAVISGNVVYVAQLGPSVVFHRRDRGLERIEPTEAALSPLGENDLEPDLRRFEMAPGEIIVAASPNIDSVIDPARLETLLSRGVDEALPEIYLLARTLTNFGLFAITCIETADDQHGASTFGEQEEESAGAADDARPAQPPPPRMVTRIPEPPPATTTTTRRAPGRRPDLLSRPGSKPASQPEDEPDSPRDEIVLHPPGANGNGHKSGFFRSVEARTVPLVAPPVLPPVLHPIGSSLNATSAAAATALLVAPAPLDISRGLVRLRGEKSIGRSDYARTTSSKPAFKLQIAQPRIAVIAGAVAVVLFVGAFTVPDLIREDRGAKVGQLVASAQVQLDAGLATPDAADKRRLLEDARRLSSEALRLDPVNTQAATLRQQAATSVSGLDAVFDLGPMTTVTTLGRQLTGEVSVEALTVAGGNAFMLDAKGGRIIASPVAGGAPSVLYQEGDTYAGVPAKKPAYFTWEGEPTSGRLLVLDAERKLFAVRPGSAPEPVPLRRTNTWASVAGIAAYGDNLYVLDPKGNQVHRYLPSVSGFDSEPTFAVSGQTLLADAVAIDVDVDVYVVSKQGQVARYRNGADGGFALGGIDRGLKTPTGIFVAAPGDEVYLADSGNKRIVVASRDGAFRRQLVSNAITDLRAVSIDPFANQLYVVVGDALLTAPIVR